MIAVINQSIFWLSEDTSRDKSSPTKYRLVRLSGSRSIAEYEFEWAAPSVMFSGLYHRPSLSREPCRSRPTAPISLPLQYERHVVGQHQTAIPARSIVQTQLYPDGNILEEQGRAITYQQAQISRIGDSVKALLHQQRHVYSMIADLRHAMQACNSTANEILDGNTLKALRQEVMKTSTRTNETVGPKTQAEALKERVEILRAVHPSW